jgi:hypothetical protein
MAPAQRSIYLTPNREYDRSPSPPPFSPSTPMDASPPPDEEDGHPLSMDGHAAIALSASHLAMVPSVVDAPLEKEDKRRCTASYAQARRPAMPRRAEANELARRFI